MMPDKSKNWEGVGSDLERIEVPSGWLYRTWNYVADTWTEVNTFVPFPDRHFDDIVSDYNEAIEALKSHCSSCAKWTGNTTEECNQCGTYKAIKKARGK